MKVRVGYGPDPLGQSTWKYIVVAETLDGKYVVVDQGGLHGQRLIDKEKLLDIHEEEVP